MQEAKVETILGSCYVQLKKFIQKQDWITVSLLQHSFRLNYPYTFFPMDILESRVFGGSAHSTGIHQLITTTIQKG